MFIAFEKKATLRQNFNFERLKLESNRGWRINVAIIRLKKFGQKRFKVVFKCSLLSRKQPLWDRIQTSRGWNWNQIEDDELILPTFKRRNLVKSASKWFIKALFRLSFGKCATKVAKCWFLMGENSEPKLLQSTLWTTDTYCHLSFDKGRPQASAAAPRLVNIYF